MTDTHSMILFNKDRCDLHSFEIRCPNCNRKLMVLNLSFSEKPNVLALEKNDLGTHNTEKRCFFVDVLDTSIEFNISLENASKLFQRNVEELKSNQMFNQSRKQE